MYSHDIESSDLRALKNLSLDELKVREDEIGAKIKELENNRQHYLTQVQNTLLAVENQFPELKTFGSYEQISQVESMLKTMGTLEYKQHVDKMNNFLKQMNPNYEPPKQTAQQMELSKLIETHASQYQQIITSITTNKNLVRDIREIISERNLTSCTNINNSGFFNDLFKKYKLSDRTQTSVEKGLRNAACNGNVEDLKQFIKLTKNINARDSNPDSGKTALDWAELKCQDESHPRHSDFMECLRLLKEAGAVKTNLSPNPSH